MTDKTFSNLMSEIIASDTFQKFREDPKQLMTAIVSDEDSNGICLYKTEDAIYFLPVMSKPVKIVY